MRPIFVFGSNLAGRHGRGAARYAVQHHGAVYGQGEGLQGDSYALPTKDAQLRSLGLEEIKAALRRLADTAEQEADLLFILTPVGCGLAGNSVRDIAAAVRGTVWPANVALHRSWLDHIA